MKRFAVKDIRDLKPCYDPNKYLDEKWKGTALDLLAREDISFKDVLWVVRKFIDEGLLRRFAAWCAAKALFVANQKDQRSWNAVEIAIKFSLGQCTDNERAAAAAAADAAAAYTAAAAARKAQRAKLISMLKKESDFTLSDLLNNYPIERVVK